MRLKSAHSCRRCGFWIEGEWGRARTAYDGAALDKYRADLQAQMDAGECWECQGERLRAAYSYIVLIDRARELTQWGVPIPDDLAAAIRAADAELINTGLGRPVSPFVRPRPRVASKETDR